MPAATDPDTAGRQFLEALGAVTDCVTDRRLFIDNPVGRMRPTTPYTMLFGPTGDPAALASRASAGKNSGLSLDVRHTFSIVPAGDQDIERGWRVTTEEYEYSLVDRDGVEALVYHWNPTAKRGPTYPHIHVSATINPMVNHQTRQTFHLDKIHIPTGRVSLESVVRLLIRHFGILGRHRDWSARLDKSELVFGRELTRRL